MKNPPLNSKLPGRSARMSREEMNQVVEALDRPIPLSETRPMTAAERRQWRHAKRRPGRPRRGRGVRVISLSVEQNLLAWADRTARHAGLSRAALFEMGLLALRDAPEKLAG